MARFFDSISHVLPRKPMTSFSSIINPSFAACVSASPNPNICMTHFMQKGTQTAEEPLSWFSMIAFLIEQSDMAALELVMPTHMIRSHQNISMSQQRSVPGALRLKFQFADPSEFASKEQIIEKLEVC
jgi:hypothetical protein